MKTTVVSEDKYRDAVKFLMGQGTNPGLSAKDQNYLRQFMRGPFACGMTEKDAITNLENMGWRKQS